MDAGVTVSVLDSVRPIQSSRAMKFKIEDFRLKILD
jgi:hypothetical protein